MTKAIRIDGEFQLIPVFEGARKLRLTQAGRTEEVIIITCTVYDGHMHTLGVGESMCALEDTDRYDAAKGMRIALGRAMKNLVAGGYCATLDMRYVTCLLEESFDQCQPMNTSVITAER